MQGNPFCGQSALKASGVKTTATLASYGQTPAPKFPKQLTKHVFPTWVCIVCITPKFSVSALKVVAAAVGNGGQDWLLAAYCINTIRNNAKLV